jgi:ectoine hydroxylase-related dioxygenase (phytanoyl-CoA dioxygenase family)
VPGSHRRGKAPEDELDDPAAPHPDERRVIAPAGSVVVFNGHLWHSGTTNESERPRRVIHAAFVRRDQPQQTDQRAFIRPETRARLDAAARHLLDV